MSLYLSTTLLQQSSPFVTSHKHNKFVMSIIGLVWLVIWDVITTNPNQEQAGGGRHNATDSSHRCTSAGAVSQRESLRCLVTTWPDPSLFKNHSLVDEEKHKSASSNHRSSLFPHTNKMENVTEPSKEDERAKNLTSGWLKLINWNIDVNYEFLDLVWNNNKTSQKCESHYRLD